ncbi:MAG: DUF2079 domain-containing protein [Oscillospiraceae bacterium]|jgi:uncharacterized membrane protein|nr:DUF2079 domain-containing protein [Oscillospiraceae bacterium]
MPTRDQAPRALASALRGGGGLALAAASVLMASIAALFRGYTMGDSFTSLYFVANFSWSFFCVWIFVSAALLLLCTWLWDNQKPLAAVLLAAGFCFALLLSTDRPSDIWFTAGLCVPLFLALRWGNDDSRFPLGRLNLPPQSAMRLTRLAAWGIFVAYTLLLSYYSILRYRTYSATNFDLGLFAQMFEFLRRTGHAWTTLERNELLTHFGVHCSPVFYLLLPVYCLFPRLETLLVLQAAGVAAGVFAVRAIAQHLFGPSPRLILGACLLYVLQPSITHGVLFDFHENKFLAVFLLWAVYFMLKNRTLPLLAFSLLTLSVKEDAAIYVVSLGLYYLLSKPWNRQNKTRVLTAWAMIVMSVAWFVCAMLIIRRYGNGVMVDRLRNYYLPGPGTHGFADIAKTCAANLGYVIKEVFTAEKAEFLLWLFLPLGFAPLLHRRGTAWLLLLPTLVINLLSNYGYQHKVGYQYTYGSAALALAMALLALKGTGPRLRRGLMLFAVMASLISIVPLTGSRMQYYAEVMRLNPSRVAAVDQVLRDLPEEAEVTATTWFCVHLYQRDNIYMYPNFYDAARPTEYFLCKPEEADEDPSVQMWLNMNGYQQTDEQAFVRVYQRAN